MGAIPNPATMIINPKIKYLAIHHTAVSRLSGNSQLNGVNAYHKQKWNARSTLGWYVGYNRFIDVNGAFTETRVIGEETIANRGHNCDIEQRCDTISICLAGNFNSELPSDVQIKVLQDQIALIQKGYPDIEITFHRDLQANRTCPGKLFTKEYLKIRILQEVKKPDTVDKEKAEKIAELMEKISLLTILLNLWKRLKQY